MNRDLKIRMVLRILRIHKPEVSYKQNQRTRNNCHQVHSLQYLQRQKEMVSSGETTLFGLNLWIS